MLVRSCAAWWAVVGIADSIRWFHIVPQSMATCINPLLQFATAPALVYLSDLHLSSLHLLSRSFANILAAIGERSYSVLVMHTSLAIALDAMVDSNEWGPSTIHQALGRVALYLLALVPATMVAHRLHSILSAALTRHLGLTRSRPRETDTDTDNSKPSDGVARNKTSAKVSSHLKNRKRG
mmetsp:Transcript_5107/g.11245  ORF Transcript_5107/g.11245 Transcript_5107/m.11245 type:complete len:181 (-) Transcript_5107:206-748(-)